MEAASIIAIDGLTVRFGGIVALDDVSFEIARGDIAGLIGPNGAGKTTCFNCITRLYHPTSGSISFDGENLLLLAAHEIAARGIVRTFQNTAIFGGMSVLDNVLVGANSRELRETRARDAAREALAYVGLDSLATTRADALSYGVRKTIELARALAARPTLLLLDEPAAGLDRHEVAALGETIRRIRADFDTTILMVEHDMAFVMQMSDRIVVLNSGRKLAEGTPEIVRNDRSVAEAYLGVA